MNKIALAWQIPTLIGAAFGIQAMLHSNTVPEYHFDGQISGNRVVFKENPFWFKSTLQITKPDGQTVTYHLFENPSYGSGRRSLTLRSVTTETPGVGTMEQKVAEAMEQKLSGLRLPDGTYPDSSMKELAVEQGLIDAARTHLNSIIKAKYLPGESGEQR